MKSKVVVEDDDTFKPDQNNFISSLQRLEKKLGQSKIGFGDQAVMDHLKNLLASRINNHKIDCIHGTLAPNLLEIDIAAGKVNGTKPAKLKKLRPE